MHFGKLSIEGAWVIRSSVHADERGFFREWFKADEFAESTGREFRVSQANISHSAKGVLRGIHFSAAAEGQAKWVTCASGVIWDVVVDLRTSSPTFKSWVGVELNAKSGNMIFIGEGLGHAFISLENNSVVSYLLSSPYSPNDEFGINPLDEDLAISWPITELLISPKDAAAPTLEVLRTQGLLPPGTK